eukprot:8530112-Alexandrium_andersonii.AAC.1
MCIRDSGWAEKQSEPISELRQRDTAQRAISDRLRMAKPELAGDSLGLERWRLLALSLIHISEPTRLALI